MNNSSCKEILASYRRAIRDPEVGNTSCPIKLQQGLKENDCRGISSGDSNEDLIAELRFAAPPPQQERISHCLTTKNKKKSSAPPSKPPSSTALGFASFQLPQPNVSANSLFENHLRQPLSECNKPSAPPPAHRTLEAGELSLGEISGQLHDTDIFAIQRLKRMKQLDKKLIGRPQLPYLDTRVAEDDRPQLTKLVLELWWRQLSSVTRKRAPAPRKKEPSKSTVIPENVEIISQSSEEDSQPVVKKRRKKNDHHTPPPISTSTPTRDRCPGSSRLNKSHPLGQSSTTKRLSRSLVLEDSLYQVESPSIRRFNDDQRRGDTIRPVFKEMEPCPLCHIKFPQGDIETHVNACLDNCT